MQVDVAQIAAYYKNLQQLFVLPVFLFAAFFVNYSIVKSKCVVGTIIGICQLLLNALFGMIFGKYQKKFMHGKDIRLRALDEMMSGIKSIKYNSYEEFFEKRVQEKRNYEINRLLKQNIIIIIMNVYTLLLPTLVVYLTVIINGVKDLEEFFLIQQGFNTISYFLSMLPAAILGTIIGLQSLRRLNTFFENDDETQGRAIEDQKYDNSQIIV